MPETPKPTKTNAKPSKRAMDPKKLKKRMASENGEPTKLEYDVAKFVRFKCPTKKTQFGHGSHADEVVYFVGSKAVDLLMESKFAKKTSKRDALFENRRGCVDYMQQILMKGLFFRARKLVPKIKTDAEKKKKGGGQDQQGGKKDSSTTKDESQKSPKPTAAKDDDKGELKRRKKGEKKEEEESKPVAVVEEEKSEKKTKKQKQKEKDDEKEEEKTTTTTKPKKVKLDWHKEQLFIDGSSIYVWRYDPTPLKTWILGAAIVIAAIGVCLFPLWPMQLRVGIYYVSSSALVLFGSFFGFIVFRTVLFGAIWACTLGRHHFWLFPNLTEDCGVLESFKPVYTYKYVPPGAKSADEKDKKKKKSKESETEDEEPEEDTNAAGIDEEEEVEENDEPRDDQATATEAETENDNELAKDDDEEGSISDDEQVGDDFDDEDEEKSEGSGGSGSNQSARASIDDEEPQTSSKKPGKKRRAMRRDDGQESSVNGDFEIVESPK